MFLGWAFESSNGCPIVSWISVIVRRMDSRSIFENFRQMDVRVAILGLGFVDFSWVTTEEVTFDYVDRAVLIVLVIFERFSSCGYSIDFRSI